MNLNCCNNTEEKTRSIWALQDSVLLLRGCAPSDTRERWLVVKALGGYCNTIEVIIIVMMKRHTSKCDPM